FGRGCANGPPCLSLRASWVGRVLNVRCARRRRTTVTQLLRGTIEAISAAALVTVAVYLWRRQHRLGVERAELLDREREERIHVEQAQADVEALLYTLSHDLKGPLFTLTGYLDLLKLEAGEGLGEAAVYVDRMAATAAQMQDLINERLTPSATGS